MKKSILISFIIILLITSFVISQEEVQQELEKAREDAKKTTENILAKQVEIPENLQVFTKIIFGLKPEDKIDLQIFIVLIALWIFFLLIIKSILKLTPFFEGSTSWIGAVVVTILVAITGAIKSSAIFFFNIGNLFGILEKWSALKFGFAIILIAIVYFVLNFFLRILKESAIINQAIKKGMIAGAEQALLEQQHKTRKELNK